MTSWMHEPLSPAPAPNSAPVLAWVCAAAMGAIGPALALFLLRDGSAPLAFMDVPLVAIGVMGAGMISAAASGRLAVGVVFSLATGAGLILLARALGLPSLLHPLATALVVAIASLSFAARGALFARSALDKGWWVAVAVVAGEAAIIATAATQPGALPDWLLVLLPAQWTAMALQSGFAGAGALAAFAPLSALAGTAAATLFVVILWPARWTYAVMFTTWIALSALVWHYPVAPA